MRTGRGRSGDRRERIGPGSQGQRSLSDRPSELERASPRQVPAELVVSASDRDLRSEQVGVSGTAGARSRKKPKGQGGNGRKIHSQLGSYTKTGEEENMKKNNQKETRVGWEDLSEMPAWPGGPGWAP